MKQYLLQTSLLFAACLALPSLADADFGLELYEDTEFSLRVNGQERHDVTCATCHEPEFYTRDDRKADSMKALRTWVNNCNSQLSVAWFPDEVDAVALFLNREYYQFPVPAGFGSE